jgi:hypothetical protein
MASARQCIRRLVQPWVMSPPGHWSASAATMTQRGSGRHFGTAQPTSRLRRDQVLLLYRRILKAAAQFPSIKRASIIEDIKIEFRENAGETNTQKIELHHATAQRSYTQLLTYCGFDPDDPDWEITTAENPMPQDE